MMHLISEFMRIFCFGNDSSRFLVRFLVHKGMVNGSFESNSWLVIVFSSSKFASHQSKVRNYYACLVSPSLTLTKTALVVKNTLGIVT
ncbi:hypothetical protein L6452_18873 [Arctium lappa]|uniref:Uncharacterized protein n=1 Tax=Arctium lappa TaxID=4217 RepID=A0ACB9C7E5_ARCLA|nr:hypothetical protein L6452_18873 [Arctium lappa]